MATGPRITSLLYLEARLGHKACEAVIPCACYPVTVDGWNQVAEAMGNYVIDTTAKQHGVEISQRVGLVPSWSAP